MERFDCLLTEKAECYCSEIGGNCLREMWEKMKRLDWSGGGDRLSDNKGWLIYIYQ